MTGKDEGPWLQVRKQRDWDALERENAELRAERQGWADLFSTNMKVISDDNERLRAWKAEATPLLAAVNDQLAGDARLGEDFVRDVLPRVVRERDALRQFQLDIFAMYDGSYHPDVRLGGLIQVIEAARRVSGHVAD